MKSTFKRFNKKVSCISGGLRSVSDNGNGCNEEIRHPCYSEEAAHYYARMHLPVAPQCNIRCNYCNRKYDCANESRPGVTSAVFSPEIAVLKAINVKKRLSRLSVVGIAGPGDPLANVEETFKTFELIKENIPDVHLCLSTNGLTLPDHIEAIKALSITHVTITINAIDPNIGKKIYRFVRLNGKKLKGDAASSILIERQLEGIKLLNDARILCKVNSVMIPGVNDEHLALVSKKIKELGAFIHNITPFIPCEGSYFHKTGQRRPAAQEMKELRLKCGVNMKMMRHCRQCRADATGYIAEEIERSDGEVPRVVTQYSG